MRYANLVTTVKIAILFTFLSACAASVPSTHTAPEMEATATPNAIPTPTEMNPYYSRSEEELATLIVEITVQIEDIFESTILAMRTAIGDDALTDEISSQVLAMLQSINVEQSDLDQAMQAYYDHFTALSTETSNQLNELQDRFETINMMIDDLISDIDNNGEINLGAIDRLDDSWAKLDTVSSIKAWQEQVLTQIDLRETFYMNIQPQSGEVAYNRVEAFIQAHDYIQAFQTAFDDGIFTPEELGIIGQNAANAEASLFNTGDPQLFGYARAIDRLTRSIVRGDWVNAGNEIELFRLSLPARPQL